MTAHGTIIPVGIPLILASTILVGKWLNTKSSSTSCSSLNRCYYMKGMTQRSTHILLLQEVERRWNTSEEQYDREKQERKCSRKWMTRYLLPSTDTRYSHDFPSWAQLLQINTTNTHHSSSKHGNTNRKMTVTVSSTVSKLSWNYYTKLQFANQCALLL